MDVGKEDRKVVGVIEDGGTRLAIEITEEEEAGGYEPAKHDLIKVPPLNASVWTLESTK